MLGVRLSLFTRIMIWFFLNLIAVALLVGAVIYLRFDNQTRLLSGLTNQIESVTRSVESDVSARPRIERDEALKKYSDRYDVRFFLFDNRGVQLGGNEIQLPESVLAEITRPEGGPPLPQSGPPSQSQPPPNPAGGPRPLSVYLTTDGAEPYWFVGRIMTVDPDTGIAARTRVIVASSSFSGNGLFFNITPLVMLVLGIVVFSMLFWLPFVRNITNAVSQMTGATKKIAEENFAVRVDDERTDELGSLGSSINDLASRLEGFVGGQKRFLGDISHELNSPLARMQFALSILEERARTEDRDHLNDVREEIELMSKLVAELLSYSKTGIQGASVELQTVNLRDVTESVVTRETASTKRKIDIDIDTQLTVEAQPELLTRAIANVVRNSLAYTPDGGSISIAATNGNKQVAISIKDDGPGVPEEMLDKIFDPLFRVQNDRSRATGGTGLGLAIVKTCVETCGGNVAARNIEPHGLEVAITLKSA